MHDIPLQLETQNPKIQFKADDKLLKILIQPVVANLEGKIFATKQFPKANSTVSCCDSVPSTTQINSTLQVH